MNPITNAVNALVESVVSRGRTPQATTGVSDTAGATDAMARDGAAGTAPAEKSAERPATPRELRDALSQAEPALRRQALSLDFRIDDSTGRTVITVRDSDTNEVVRQIPPEETLNLARSLEAIARDGRSDLSNGALIRREA